jgi:integrase
MSELKPGDPITREIVERWFKSMEHLSPATRINRISILRQFCLYLSHFDPRTCIIHRSFVPHRTRPVPHIYTRGEVRQIMAASRRIGPAQGLRPVVLSTLVALLYTTGLRVGEALKLTIGEVDLKRRLIHVRESKFKKSRYVPISPSTADQLAAYLRQLRKAGYPTSPNSPFFVAPGGGRYGKSAFARPFSKSFAKSVSAVLRDNGALAFMTFVTRLQ